MRGFMISAAEANRTDFSDLGDYTKHIRFARVTKVFDASTLAESKDYGCVNLAWTDTEDQINGPVSFLKTGYSSVFGYGIIVMPSVGDIAACYTVTGAPPIILGFFSKDQFSATKAGKDNASSLAYIQPLRSGEILIKGKSQSEILLKNDGRVKVTVKDGTNTNTVYNNDNQYTTDTFLEKPSCADSNTVVEMELGNSEELAGPANQVFSLTAGGIVTQDFAFMATPNVLQYSLNPVTKSEILGVEAVKFYAVGENGKEVLKKSLGPSSRVGLIKSYYYTQGLTKTNDIEQNSCTMDSNGVITSVTLPPDVNGLLTKNTKVVVTLRIKNPKFSFKVNSLGDALIDCRNFIVRAAEKKSYLGLFDDARAVVGAVNTEIGDKLTGFVRTDRDGVHISSGSFSQSAIETTNSENIKSVVGDSHYFYIADEFPLFAYTPDDKSNPYHIVLLPEYAGLSSYTKARITSRPFDPDYNSEGFTRAAMNKLINQAKESGNAWLAYGKLRAL